MPQNCKLLYNFGRYSKTKTSLKIFHLGKLVRWNNYHLKTCFNNDDTLTKLHENPLNICQ